MSYETLRRLILDSISMSLEQKRNAEPYFRRLRKLQELQLKGVPSKEDSVYKVLNDFVKNHVGRREYSVTIDGKTYPVVLKKDIAGKVSSGIRGKGTKEVMRIARLLIVCLSNIDDVLENGRKTKFVPNAAESDRHKGAQWLYVNDYSVEPGLTGEVTVEIEFPEEKGRINSVYHVTTEGSVGYEQMMEARIIPKFALEGEVTIRRK